MDPGDEKRAYHLRLPLLLLLAAGLVLCAPLAALAARPARIPADVERLAAEQRWQARPVAHYRIVSRMGDCMQRGEFRGDEIISVSRKDCLDTIRTVEWLFALIARVESWGLARPRCAPSGCICRETRRIYAVYDDLLGYPRAVRLRKTRAIDWIGLLRNPEAYRAALDCATPPEIELFRVESLEVLP
jgi:hypothetical protein